MRFFGFVIIGLLVILFFFVLLRWRSRRGRFIQKGLKHPTGFFKYHPRTQTKLKKAFQISKDAKENDKSIATLSFKGDIKATQRRGLSHIIDEIILNKENFDEVVVQVESPGGAVAEYGHCYAEMMRLTTAGLKLTVCVDTVAASGGYLLCLPATKIIAAPFSMIGSIGVVSFIPNIRKLLERFQIEPRTFTSGDYKRTVSLTDNASPDQVQHFQQQLQLIHDQFKQALKIHRPEVDLDSVATGEVWLASATMEKKLGLVDQIGLYSDTILEWNRTHDVVEFSYPEKKRLFNKWFDFFSSLRLMT